METRRPAWRTASAVVLSVMLLASMGCSTKPRDAADLAEAIPFDDRRIVFYWHGVRILSPADIRLVDGRLSINGVREVPETVDTTGADARLVGLFQGVPFVDSLVERGSSYVAAVNAYGREMPGRFRRALLQLRREARGSGDPGPTPSRSSLAERLGVPADSIDIDEVSVSCTFPGGLTWSERLDVPDTVLAIDPFYDRPPTKREDEAYFSLVVSSLHEKLAGRSPKLIVHQSDALVEFEGQEALDVEGEIARAIQGTDTTNAPRRLTRTSRISTRLLRTIMERHSAP